jgi:hypothetical protein
MTRVTKTVNSTLLMGQKSLEAKRKLELQGLYMPVRPVYARPELPDDLTGLDDKDLMQLMGQSTQWVNYLSTQLAAAEVDEKYAEQSLENVQAVNRIMNRGEKSVTAIKAMTHEDPAYKEASEKLHEAYAFRKLNAALYANEERNNFLYSREVTRRVGRNDRDNRTARYTT